MQVSTALLLAAVAVVAVVGQPPLGPPPFIDGQGPPPLLDGQGPPLPGGQGGRPPFPGGQGGRPPQRPPFPMPESCVKDMKAVVDCIGLPNANPMAIARDIGVFGPQDDDNCLVKAGCDIDSIRLIARDILQKGRAFKPSGQAQVGVQTETNVQAKGNGNKGKGKGQGRQNRLRRQTVKGQANASAQVSVQQQIRECVSEELGMTAAAQIKECMGDALPEKTEGGAGPRPQRLFNILSEVIGNKDRLLELCADPELALKCASGKIGQELTKENIQEKCECFTGPSDQCRTELETAHKKACECGQATIDELSESACQEIQGFNRLTRRIATKTCSPPELPVDGHKPPICTAELPDDIFDLGI